MCFNADRMQYLQTNRAGGFAWGCGGLNIGKSHALLLLKLQYVTWRLWKLGPARKNRGFYYGNFFVVARAFAWKYACRAFTKRVVLARILHEMSKLYKC